MTATRSGRSVLLGAALLMATSAIGPGFLTQTALFTQQLGASFGFVILASILLDIGAQTNVWRVLAVTERRGPEGANLVLPGLGHFVTLLVVLGGLAFNIGNVAGTGLALELLLGWSPKAGAVASSVVAIALFLLPRAGTAMDRLAQVLGFVMIGAIVYIAFASSPPWAQAAARSVVPDQVVLFPIVTLVGGTVGGYITFAGGHRLLDAGVKGAGALGAVTKSAVAGIVAVSFMRVFLFLAALGVVASGFVLDPGNPAASIFGRAAGPFGQKLFGVVLWSAAITSVVGSSYTSISFLRTSSAFVDRRSTAAILGFIGLSTLVFVAYGRPVKVLLLAGALNGLVLPVTLGTMLVAAHKRSIVGEYRHPLWMTLLGSATVAAMAWMGGITLVGEIPKLFR